MTQLLLSVIAVLLTAICAGVGHLIVRVEYFADKIVDHDHRIKQIEILVGSNARR